MREELGLDNPLPIRYFTWIAGALHGDFGESVFTRNPVSEDLVTYFPTTLQLLLLTLAEIIVFSLLLGVLCAAKQNKLIDHIMRGISILGICLPSFWLGFLLLIAFAVEIPIFSVTTGSGNQGADTSLCHAGIPSYLFHRPAVSCIPAGGTAPGLCAVLPEPAV